MKSYQVKIKLKEGIKDIEAETLMTFVDASVHPSFFTKSVRLNRAELSIGGIVANREI